MYKIILLLHQSFLKVLNFEVVVRNLRYFARDRTYIYATRLYIQTYEEPSIMVMHRVTYSDNQILFSFHCSSSPDF